MSYERKIKITGSIPKIYDYFKEWKPQYSDISKDKYIKVCHAINKKLANAIVTKSLEVKLPHRLGYLRIQTADTKVKFKDGKLDMKKNKINWAATKKLWKELYPDKTKEELKNIPNKKLVIHTNDHSNGKYFRWNWDKRLSNIRNISSYIFKPVKGPQTQAEFEDRGSYHYGRRGLVKWINNEDKTNEYYM